MFQSFLRSFLLATAPLAAIPSGVQEQVLHEWNFRDGVGEWQAAHSVAPLTLRDGRLVVAVTGPDPYVHSSPTHSFNIHGNPRQFISLRAKCSHTGTAEWFWTAEIEGRDAGFVAGQEVGFTVLGDGEWHTYNVFPGWTGRITRIRFDPPDLHEETQVIEIEWVQIAELAGEPSPGPAWDFTQGLQGFVPQRDVERFDVGPDGVSLAGYGTPAFQISDLALGTADFPWLSLEASAPQRTEVKVMWETTEQRYNALSAATVTLQPSPGPRYYNVCLAENERWTGQVTGLRLTWEADEAPEVTLKSLALSPAPRGPAALELLEVKASALVVPVGEAATIRATVRNTGGEVASAVRATVETPAGWTVEPPQQNTPALAPGERLELRFRVQPAEPGFSTATLVAVAEKTPAVRSALDFVVSRPWPPLTDGLATSGVGELDDGTFVVASSEAALLLPRNPYGYGPLFLAARTPDGWRRVASSPYVAQVRATPDGPPWNVFPDTLSVGMGAGDTPFAELRATRTDEAGRTWSVKVFLAPLDDPSLFQMTALLSVDQPADLYRFAAPMLLVGDGTFGPAKNEALFPGLEYLESHEGSSTTRDIAPPQHLRLAPHPHRITVPLLAVTAPAEAGTGLVALLWDIQQEWSPGETLPTAVFASPNFVDQRDDHLLGLFVPSIPRYVPENELVAQTPFPLAAGQPVRLAAQVLIRPRGQVLDAVRAWYDFYGPPPPTEAPRSDAEVYALSLRGLEEVLYTEGQGWAGVKGWAPGPDPGTGLIYTLLAGELGAGSPVPDLRQKARDRAYRAYGLPLALHLGGVEPALLNAHQGAVSALRSREPDGRWVFHPSEQTKVLGPAGETVVGMGTGPVGNLLRGAARLANEQLLAEGLKGLEFLDTFRVPRGAQVWECPLYAPDVLASAQAVRAYLWGYRLTGEEKYLKRAVYWAETGLPFIYVWQSPQPGLEPMQGGSIPIFGATFFTGSWFGRLVQWNGLEYADALLDLARYDKTYNWTQVAASIIASGLRQQRTEPEYLGLYPDSWGMIDGSIAWGLMLGPQGLVHALLKLRGRNPDGDVRLFRSDDRLVSLQTVGQLFDIHVGQATGGEVVADLGTIPFDAAFTVRYDLAEHSYAALVGVAPPEAVTVNGQPWPEVVNVEEAEAGWTYSEAIGGVILKLTHPAEANFRAVVELRGLACAEPQTDRRRWTFERGSTEGWHALNHVQPLTVKDGALVIEATGGDPFIGSAPLLFDAGEVSAVAVRLRTRQSGTLQLFWDRGQGYTAAQAATVEVQAGEEFQEAVIPVRGHELWTGPITALRLDPPGGAGNVTEVKAVELR